MEISTLQIIAIFLFSCIAGMGSVLDEFQTHRPLIACTVIGLILGDLKTGIMLGGTLELIALGWMNVGAAQSPDSALASIISAILVIVGQQSIAHRNRHRVACGCGRPGADGVCPYHHRSVPARGG